MIGISYFATEFDDDAGFEKLKAHLRSWDGKFNTGGNRLFYLAVAPEFFADITHRLGKHGMAKPEAGQNHWIRVIIEKPFGTDLESARKLNDEINDVLAEDQIFRIDHYLGKETVQNILVFRFGNGIFEPVWNRNFIDHVEITAAESIGIEDAAVLREGWRCARCAAEPRYGSSVIRCYGATGFIRGRGGSNREVEGLACD